MNYTKKILCAENGSVLFFTLMILVMMAAAGFTMISNSMLESNIVRNVSSRTLNFYAAEAAAMEVAQMLQDEDDTHMLNTHNADWLNPNGASDPKLADITVPWDFDGTAPDNADPGSIANTAFTTVRVGVAKSASLGMENPDLLYEYAVLGRLYDLNNPATSADDVVLAMIEPDKKELSPKDRGGIDLLFPFPVVRTVARNGCGSQPDPHVPPAQPAPAQCHVRHRQLRFHGLGSHDR